MICPYIVKGFSTLNWFITIIISPIFFLIFCCENADLYSKQISIIQSCIITYSHHVIHPQTLVHFSTDSLFPLLSSSFFHALAPVGLWERTSSCCTFLWIWLFVLFCFRFHICDTIQYFLSLSGLFYLV